MEDYKFKYSFDEGSKEFTHFNEFMKDNLLNILSFCELYDKQGYPVDVSSFRLKHMGETPINLYDDIKKMVVDNTSDVKLTEDEKALGASEPRIGYVINTIKRLEKIVDFYSGDSQCKVDTIEIKDCKQWLLNEKNHPSAVYQYLAATCNANCKFCYLQANPQNIRIGKRGKVEDCSWKELQTRIKYFEKTSNLFSPNYEIKEFFNSPYFERTLSELRKKNDDDFTFVTNGSLLTEKKIRFLSTIMPVVLIISVIVISKKARGELLFGERLSDERDQLNQVMMNSFPLLNKYKVPFIGSITAWPTIKYDNFVETIHYLEQFDPIAIRVNMLGYTEKNEPSVPISDDFWKEFCTYIDKVSKETDIPLIPIPSQYYVNEFQDDVLDIEVLGVIKNSPTYGKVFKKDKIRKINGSVLTSRDQLLDALRLISGKKTLTIERENGTVEVTLDEDTVCYPYMGTYYGKYQFPYGLVIPEGIQFKQIKHIVKIFEMKNASHALLIVGPLLRNTVSRYFEMLGWTLNDIMDEVSHDNKRIRVASSVNYFLGGNMQIMDMCVTTDLIRVVENSKNENTDLVILADSMFNIWGNDLLGVNKCLLEKCLDIPVAFINSKTVPY